MREKISQVIHSALGLSQEALLRQLNPRLRGWANYYRNGAAKRTFADVDHYVDLKLWRWAKRRHPNKSRAWKRHKYYSAAGEGGGFSVRIQRRGQSGVLQLYRLVSTRIERHLKVKGAAHPYDPKYTEYFERRRCFAWRTRPG